MNKDILAYFQSINKGYIHPKGKKATQILLNEMDPGEDEKILELGYGTGASLIHTLAHQPAVKLYGVEGSDFMLRKAMSRIKFCGLKNQIELSLIGSNKVLPYQSNFFDKIYIESVLAIQDGNDLAIMIQELKRVLKPEGIICINELLWNNEVPFEKIRANNKYVLQNFGIIQANGKYPYYEDWVNLFKQNDFILKKSIKLNESHHLEGIKTKINPKLFRSHLFTLIGMLKSKILLRHRNDWGFFKSKMNKIDQEIRLDPYVLKFIKTEC